MNFRTIRKKLIISNIAVFAAICFIFVVYIWFDGKNQEIQKTSSSLIRINSSFIELNHINNMFFSSESVSDDFVKQGYKLYQDENIKLNQWIEQELKSILQTKIFFGDSLLYKAIKLIETHKILTDSLLKTVLNGATESRIISLEIIDLYKSCENKTQSSQIDLSNLKRLYYSYLRTKDENIAATFQTEFNKIRTVLNKKQSANNQILLDNLNNLNEKFQLLIRYESLINPKQKTAILLKINIQNNLITKTLEQINSNLQKKENSFTKTIRILFAGSFIFSIIVIILSIYYVNKYFGLPVKRLTQAIHQLVNSNFTGEVNLPEIKTKDEIALLTSDLRTMISKVKEYTTQLITKSNRAEESISNIKLLNFIGEQIITNLSVEKIVETVYKHINKLIDVYSFAIGLYESEQQVLEFYGYSGKSNELQISSDDINNKKLLAVWCFENNSNIFINDIDIDSKQYIDHFELPNILFKPMSAIYVPLIIAEEKIGVITIKSLQKNSFTEHHLDILSNLAIYISIAIQNAKAFEHIKMQQREILERNEELNQQREEILLINETLEVQKNELSEAFQDIQLLSKIGQQITAKLDFDSIFQTIYDNLGKFMDVSTFGIGLYNKEKNSLIFNKVIEKGQYLPALEDNLDKNDLLSVRCFRSGTEIIIKNLRDEFKNYFPKFPTPREGEIPDSIVYLPLILNDKQFGVLTIQAFVANAYSEKDINILRSLATYIMIAIENSEQYEKIEQQKNEILHKSNELQLANEKINETIFEIENQKTEMQVLAEQLKNSYLQMKESEQQMADIINFVPDPLLVIDKNGKLIAWNRNMEKLTGVKAVDIVGKDNYEHALPFYGERRPMLADLILNRENIFMDKYTNIQQIDDVLVGQAFVPKLNVYLWGSAGLLYDSNHQVIGAIQVSRDVTEPIRIQEEINNANILLRSQKLEIEKQNEEIIAKSQELTELVEELKATSSIVEEYNKELENLSIVASKTDNSVIIADSEGNIEWVNDAFVRLFDMTFDTFIETRGRNMRQVSAHPDIETVIDNAIKKKKSAVYSTKNLSANGQELWLQTTLTPIFDNDGILTKIIAIDTDISKIKEAEKEIASQNKKITYSLQYARRIQAALLPQTRFINRILAEHFILYKPKDIVSGDFYWITRKQTKILVAVADCTGHGVPGAFMSILGISFLNEIINKIVEKPGIDFLRANEVLNLLRENIIKTLHQKGKDKDTKDGMDIALCIFDIDNRTIEFAGANNPMYLIRKISEDDTFGMNDENTAIILDEVRDIKFVEIIPDKMPIGYYKNEDKSFKSYTFNIKAGDCIYLFTDGYIDQFGGEKARKFLSFNFRKLLIDIHRKPMEEQNQILDSTIENWRKAQNDKNKIFNQIDDILVMGFRF